MLNSGRRGKRAPDGYGIQSVNEKFNQANYPIPIIDSWTITNGSYVPIDDTALDTAGGQTVVVYGSGFTSGVTVNINGTNISPVTLLDSGRLTFTSPTLASASYTIYVSNTDGATAIYVPGLVYSGLPTWSSPAAGTIGTNYETKSTSLLSSNTFIATGDAPITYSITSGNLPSGVTLSSGGVLSGSLPATASSTTYSFTITASDAQKQDSSRSFSLTINPDVVTWVAPTQNGSLTVYETKAFSTPLSATSAAGYGVMYAANTLPTGITLSTDSGALNGYANTVGTTNVQLTATANTTSRYALSNVLFTVTQDSVTWSSPANNTTYSLGQGIAMSSVPLTATSAAGYGVQYTANSLPTGVTLSGGTISGTPTVSGTSTTQLTATANTTNRVSYVYINWSVSIASDTYFANTVLLLTANSQLQTASFITDNSNNNTQLTIAGDTKPNLFNPYNEGYYSNYFDGTGDRLITSSGPSLGSGDFTIEGWIYCSTLPTNARVLSQGTYTTGEYLWIMYSTGGADFTESTTARLTFPSGSFTVNSWMHFAIVRSGTSLKGYVNGVNVASATSTYNYSATTSTYIGSNSSTANQDFNGYISNLRITKGTALYTANFTIPTSPLSSIANTVLLTCQSNRLIDNSTNNFAITKNGDVTVSSAYPFATPTTSSYNTRYSTTFDGTGDYLSATSNAVFAFGTGDYTLEFWIYPTVALSSTRCFYNNNSGGYFLQWASGSGLQTGIAGSSTTGTYSVTINTSQWTHVAISRASGSSRCFINGTQSGTTLTDNTNYTQNGAYIGALYDGSQAFTGYISNLRVVKGQALYTSTFTPSTTPLTTTSQSAIASNVSLLTCQNSTLIDNSTNALVITSAGQAQPIAQSPFTMTTSTNTLTSLGSAYFDGAGDYLTIPTNAGFQFGTGDFNCESWVYISTAPGSFYTLWGDVRWSGGYSSGWCTIINSNLTLTSRIYGTTGGWTEVTSTATLNLNSWNHIAVSRASGTFRNFVNGVLSGSQGSATYNYTNAEPFKVGIAYIDGLSNPLTGYISDLRAIKGTALYTANFLPPQAPLTPVANTQLLTCQTNGGGNNNGFVDQSSFNNLITRNGNPTQGTFSPFSQTGWSNYFGGQMYSALSPSSTNFNLTGDFTIESWVYPTSLLGGEWGVLDARTSGGSATPWLFGINTTSKLYFYDGTYRLGSTTLTTNTWHHMCWVRNGSVLRGFLNGVLEYYNGSYGTGAISPGSTSPYIGTKDYTISTYGTTGYISNLRVVNGTAVYTTSSTTVGTGIFTPPTSPLTAVANTVLLTAQSNRFNDSGPNNYTITPSSSTISVQAYSPFGGVTSVPTSYSNYFDGTGDYLSSVVGAPLSLPSTSDFTIEFWLYIPNLPSILGYVFASTYGGTSVYSYISSAGIIVFGTSSGGTREQSNSALSINTWYHVAICRSGATERMFINGTAQTQTSGQTTHDFSTIYFATNTNQDYYTRMYLSNFRIVKQTALYTSNFTVPTAPLTAIANTQLLTCQSERMIDNSTNNYVITGTGDAKPSTFNPFGTTTTTSVSYSPSVNGGSMYFDGTGDYLTVGTFAPGTNNFTVDFWFYCTALPASGQQGIFFATPWGANNLQVYIKDSSNIAWQAYTQNNADVAVKINQWYHVAVVKNGSTGYFYVNGVLQNTATLTNSISGTAYVGARGADALYFTGYISDMRTSIGSVLYTANFYPGSAPATPRTTIGANTYTSQLYLTGTSGGIIDQSGKTTLETVGNTQLASEYPYAGSYYSNYSDGNGDYLTVPSAAWTTLTGTFTIEYWIKWDVAPAAGNITGVYASGGWALYNDGTRITPNLYGTGNIFNSTFLISSIVLGQWYHLAFTRDSSNLMTMWVNGVSVGSTTTATTYTQGTWYIFSFNNTNAIQGNISNFRVTNNCLYTTTFTPSTTPLTAVSGTQLLTCQSNKFVDNSTNNATLTATGTVAVKSYNPFQRNIGQSIYFDGTGDYLYSNASQTNYGLQFATGDYTVEYWVNPTSLATAATHFNLGFLKANTTASTGATTVYGGSAGTTLLITGAAITGSAWTHIAVTRQSGVGTTLWINGTRSGAVAVDSTSYANSALFIGSTNAATYPFTGYLTDFRITKGTARYTANNTAYLNSGSPYMNK